MTVFTEANFEECRSVISSKVCLMKLKNKANWENPCLDVRQGMRIVTHSTMKTRFPPCGEFQRFLKTFGCELLKKKTTSEIRRIQYIVPISYKENIKT